MKRFVYISNGRLTDLAHRTELTQIRFAISRLSSSQNLSFSSESVFGFLYCSVARLLPDVAVSETQQKLMQTMI